MRAWLALLCVIAAGCDDGVVTLGRDRPPLYHFGTPRFLSELDAGFNNENPTLTGDRLELFYNSNHGDAESDLWTARRESLADPFSTPELIAELNSPGYDVNPGISLDGLSLYFASDRGAESGAFDVWFAGRPDRSAPWTTPENLPALSSPAKDIPRSPGQHGLALPIASQRDTPEAYQLYLSSRSNIGAPFGEPVLVPELSVDAGMSIGDAFLSDDGLTLFYASSPAGKPDLFVAWRKSTSQPFSVSVPLEDLNTDGDERDPWLSPDGTVLYFVSDRSGTLQIYEAAVTREP